MSSSNTLFLLIKSLTKAEKRVFKLYNTEQDEKKNYITLFDAMDRQKVYDEKKITIELKNKINIRHFSREKNRLYNIIIKSMNTYYSYRYADSSIKEMIGEARFLFNKGFYQACEKVLYKAKKLAQKYDNPLAIIEIIQRQKQLARKFRKLALPVLKNDELTIQQQQAILDLESIYEYESVSDQLTALQTLKGRMRGKYFIKEIQKKINATSFRDNDSFYLCLNKLRAVSLYHNYRGNWGEAVLWQKKVVSFLDKNPEQVIQNVELYIENCYSLLNMYMYQKKFDERFYQTLDAFRNIPKHYFNSLTVPERVKVKYFSIYYFTELQQSMSTGNYENGYKYINEVQEHINTHSTLITSEEKIVCYINFAIITFAIKKYSQSLVWANEILNNETPNIRSDVYSFAKTFTLILHYELGHYDFLEYLSKSTYRFLNKKNLFYNLEKTLYSFMKNIVTKTRQLEIKKEFEELKSQLILMEKNSSERAIFDNFDFISWAESKTEGISFSEATKKRLLLK